MNSLASDQDIVYIAGYALGAFRACCLVRRQHGRETGTPIAPSGDRIEFAGLDAQCHSGPDTAQPAVVVEMAPAVSRPAARRAEQSPAPATTCAHSLHAGHAAGRGVKSATHAEDTGRS